MARQRNVPVIVDPANLADYLKYKGATALKLNRTETERATKLPLGTEAENARAAQWLPSNSRLK